MTTPRAILPLLKAPITNITPQGFTILLGAQYGSPTSIRIAADTSRYDLRDGDLLTIYTEVLMKGPTQ
jgi:hypothetical protein